MTIPESLLFHFVLSLEVMIHSITLLRFTSEVLLLIQVYCSATEREMLYFILHYILHLALVTTPVKYSYIYIYRDIYRYVGDVLL